jgi:hypothetical protein
MGIKQTIFSTFAIVGLLIWPIMGQAKKSQSDQHVEVSLRKIGHELLLDAGDNTSRVMPVTQHEGRFVLQFASEFGFVPDSLVNAVEQVMAKARIADAYFVEVEQCDTKEVVYTYEVTGIEEEDLTLCYQRELPEDCYMILFTLMDGNGVNILSSPERFESIGQLYPEESYLSYVIAALVVILLLVVLYYLRNQRRRARADSNLIQLGDYYFDNLNTELIIHDQRIGLTSKEADLLRLLYDTVNTTVEREVILNMVWGDEGDYVGRTLDVFISKLRKKLEADAKVKIVNIRGVGYKLVMDV